MTLSELAIKRRIGVLMVLVSLVLLGLVALVRLPLAFMPDFEQPEVFVRVSYPNASPSQVERMIVRPLEEVLGTLSGLSQMWSNCDADGGMVRLEFTWSTNLNLARVEIWEKLDRVRRDLPDDIGDITVSSSWNSREADQPILEGRLASKRNLSESYDLLERKILNPLERIPGVAQVRIDGVSPREVRINLRVDDLERHQMDVRQVANLLQNSNFDQSLGWVTEGEMRWSLRTTGTLTTPEEIAALPLRADGLQLRDVADVSFSEPPLEYGRHLDGDFAVGISISQESKANTVEVCKALKAKIAGMSRDPELEGVSFLVWFNQGQEIQKTLRDLMFTGVFGAILATLVLFAFLRRLTPTIIATLCIPFSLIVACGIIWARGTSLNTLTLLGLIVGIGMLVDNAVVVMENIFRYREQGMEQKKAARLGAKEVSTAVTAATLTSVIVFMPLIFNKPSEMNIYLKELAITVCLTLLASLFVSQTLIPLATSWFIRSRPKGKSRAMLWLESKYHRVLSFQLRHRWMAPLIGLTITASAAYPYTKIDKNFDSSESELFVQIRYDFSEEHSLQDKEKLVSLVESRLEPHREELMARSIYSWWSDRYTLTRVYLHEGQANEENLSRVRNTLRRVLPDMPGLKLEIQENRQFWRHDQGKRVAAQLVGEDSEVLARLAEQIKPRLAEIPGLHDPFAGTEEGSQELHIELDRDLASQYGVQTSQPGQVVGLTYRGRRLPRYRSPQGEREMRLTLDEQETESLSQLQQLPLRNEEGERVPLASVADFHVKQGAYHIRRDNRKTSVWVGASFEKGNRQQYMPAVTQALNSIEYPYGYSWTFGRWQQRHQEKSKEFLTNLGLALLLVFAVMAGLFESIRQAIALMVALPFAIAGAAWTLYFTGTDFDQPAAVGLLLLIGIVVNNGIVMIEHINMYRRRGMERTEAMLKGGRERLRPIIMTALTTLIGLMPIAIQKPSLGGVYYYSMALVIMGGLLVSTFLTSLLLPTTVTLVEDIARWPQKLRLPGRKPRSKAA